MTDSALGDLATALNDLYRLSGSARFHEQTVAATGVAVSRTGLHFLSLVADTGPVSATRLAAGLDLSQPTASRVLQSLETEGLVTRQADDKDGRVSHYVVTPKGRRALDKVHSYHVENLDDRARRRRPAPPGSTCRRRHRARPEAPPRPAGRRPFQQEDRMTAATEIRQIEAGAAPERYARGWHCLGLVSTFADGKPHSVEAFGGKLVVWQGADGALKCLDAYCRHMGGDLSMGEVDGDNIACPFHGWRWAGDGKCADIPYAKRIPPRARTKTWPTLEKNGHLFVWNDPEGNPPPDDVTIPDFEGYASGEWTDWTWDTVPVNGIHCREVVDNMVDMAHFYYIHKGLPTYFKNVFEGHLSARSTTPAPTSSTPRPVRRSTSVSTRARRPRARRPTTVRRTSSTSSGTRTAT